MVTARKFLTFVALLIPAIALQAQTSSGAKNDVFRMLYAPRDRTVEITGGVTVPLSHEALKQFWTRGPSAEILFLGRASYNVKFGIGGEVSLLSFRRGIFALAYPDVATQVKHLATVYLYLAIRSYLKPGLRLSPYVGFDVGVLRVTGAEYKEIINGVRFTYYDIPGISRLAGSVSLGGDYYLSRRIALLVHGRAMHVFNDPNVGFLLSFHAGVKFTI
jgi:hypothetical protein